MIVFNVLIIQNQSGIVQNHGSIKPVVVQNHGSIKPVAVQNHGSIKPVVVQNQWQYKAKVVVQSQSLKGGYSGSVLLLATRRPRKWCSFPPRYLHWYSDSRSGTCPEIPYLIATVKRAGFMIGTVW